VGRLDDIIERNKNPRRALRRKKGVAIGGLVSVVLFVVLLLLIFTNLAQPPEDAYPQPAAAGSSEHRVRDIRLGGPRVPVKHVDPLAPPAH